jgi:hypothetical protein
MKTTALFVCVGAAAASASIDLRITEMWPGNDPGTDITEDWFEITNFGTTDWNLADGTLYFDDDSMLASAADALMGITNIAAGETVVFIDDTSIADFLAAWGDTGTQVGTYSGSGLGGGGDGVTLFFDIGDGGVDAGDIIDFQAYPDADPFGGQSYDVLLGGFSTVGNASDAYQSLIANNLGQFGIASPGTIPAAPVLAPIALAGLAASRRRR